MPGAWLQSLKASVLSILAHLLVTLVHCLVMLDLYSAVRRSLQGPVADYVFEPDYDN